MTAPALGRLEVERQSSPLSIDVRRPRFSWTIVDAPHGSVQTSYRVVVEDRRRSVVWDSGVQTGGDPSAVADHDLALTSLSDWTWTVRVDIESPEGQHALEGRSSFGTGALTPPDAVSGTWDGSHWIAGAGGPAIAAPLIRLPFVLDRPVVHARLAIAAGGYAATTVNGAPASDDRLSPGLTDFEDRVHYAVHDVTGLLVEGKNVLAFALGRGFYGMTTENTWNWHRAPWHDEPCVRGVLVAEHADGATRVVTGAAGRTARGGTRADSLYEGEVFDARQDEAQWRLAGFDDAAWEAATIVDGPRGRLVARPYPGIRVTETLAPVTSTAHGEGSFVLDFGRQVAGWTRIELPEATPEGADVTLTHAERLVHGRPAVFTPFSAGELQEDHYTTAGGAATWEPSFGYKGFQYVGVEGWPGSLEPASITARVAHSDLERRARFACSDELLTWMHEAAVQTMLNNLHHIPTDTPVFEKNGWTGDARLAADMMVRDLDSVALLEDWCRTLSDSRDATGRPALIAPTPDWHWPDHMESPPWHAAYVMVPWQIYRATGDAGVLREHVAGIFRYVRLEHALAVDGISTTGLGDYLAPDKPGNPDEDLRVCATASVYDCTLVAAQIADLLGDGAAADEMRGRARIIRAAFVREFFDPRSGSIRDSIAGFRQTHNILALRSGLVPPGEDVRVAKALAHDVTENRGGHLWVGALGVRRALQVLDAYGFEEIAFRAATKTDPPSWGNWRAQGATTMWEYWDDARSRNHYFFGTVDDWLFSNVAGIAASEPGYRRVSVQPRHLARLEWAEAEIETVRGPLAVAWRRDGESGVLSLRVPVGTTADVMLPGAGARSVASGRTELGFTLGGGRTT